MDTSGVTGCSAAGATNHPSLLGTEENPRMQDFRCYNQESLGQARMCWSPYLEGAAAVPHGEGFAMLMAGAK